MPWHSRHTHTHWLTGSPFKTSSSSISSPHSPCTRLGEDGKAESTLAPAFYYLGTDSTIHHVQVTLPSLGEFWCSSLSLSILRRSSSFFNCNLSTWCERLVISLSLLCCCSNSSCIHKNNEVCKNYVRFAKNVWSLQKFCEVCKNCVSFVVHLEIDCWSKKLFTVTIATIFCRLMIISL